MQCEVYCNDLLPLDVVGSIHTEVQYQTLPAYVQPTSILSHVALTESYLPNTEKGITNIDKGLRTQSLPEPKLELPKVLISPTTVYKPPKTPELRISSERIDTEKQNVAHSHPALKTPMSQAFLWDDDGKPPLKISGETIGDDELLPADMFYSGHQVLKKTRSLTDIVPMQVTKGFADTAKETTPTDNTTSETVADEYRMSQLATTMLTSQQKEFIEFIENKHDLNIFNNEINVYSVNLDEYHKIKEDSIFKEDNITPDVFVASSSPNAEKVNITTDAEPLAARVLPSDFMSIKVLSEVCSMTQEEAEKLIQETRRQHNNPDLSGEDLLSAAIGVFYAVKTPATTS